MARGAGGFLRDNAFLVAAVSLPLVVVGFFVLFTAIPRWMVPPPRYDLLLHTSAYDQSVPRVAVDFIVRDGTLEAKVRGVLANAYPQRPVLWLFDHRTMNVRQIPVDLPDQLAADEPPRTIAVAALAGRRVVAETRAPDGYELQTRSHGSPGLIGDLFGMRRYDHPVLLVNRGRVVEIRLPSPYEHQPAAFVGWLIDEGTR